MYLFESLEIGKSKYLDMRGVLLNEQIKFPGYNKLATHRLEVTLSRHIDVVSKEYPVGVAISYRLLLTYTIKRLLTLKIDTKETDYPLCIRISDGLDGSGCHRIINRQNLSLMYQPKDSSCLRLEFVRSSARMVHLYGRTLNLTPRFLCVQFQI